MTREILLSEYLRNLVPWYSHNLSSYLSDDALVTGFEEVVYPGYQSLPWSSLTPGSQYSGQANL